MVTVILRKRVIVTDGLVFEAEREVSLPIQPFVGLQLYNTEWRTPGCDQSEDSIEEIAYDFKTGRLLCYLPHDDFRPDSSGSDDWTEEDVRQRYRDWKIDPDYPRKPPWNCEWN
jgi:hypothetical protein